MPGPSWNTWVTVPVILHAPVGYVAPVAPMVSGTRRPTVAVNAAAMPALQVAPVGGNSGAETAVVMPRTQPPVVRAPLAAHPAGAGQTHTAGAGRGATSAHSGATSHATH